MFVDPRHQPFVRPKRRHLPHLYKPWGTYFITCRLHDAVVYRSWDALDKSTEDQEDLEPADLLGCYDPPLTLGSCALGEPDVAKMTVQALLHYQTIRYDLHAWCVMPNHVHLVLQTRESWMPDAILRDWKGFTARSANALLGRRGSFWEDESFDYLIRASASIGKFVAYTEHNPRMAGLCQRPEEWPYSSRFGRSVMADDDP